MTIDDIRPALRGRYRNRVTGVVATVKSYSNGTRRPDLVHLVLDSGYHWWGTRDEFWASWINADLTIRH